MYRIALNLERMLDLTVDDAFHLAPAILNGPQSVDVTETQRNTQGHSNSTLTQRNQETGKTKIALRQQVGYNAPRFCHPGSITSREHYRLGVHRSSISSNTLTTKHALNIYPPGLIESDAPSLHDNVYIALSILVQPCARIAGFDVLGQVEVGAM